MGSNLRFLYRNLGHLYTPAVTSEVTPGFEARNLYDGNRHTFWKATSTADQFHTFDVGSGNTESVGAVIITRGDLLAQAGASVDVQWSADAATGWTSVGAPLPEAPIVAGDLKAPTLKDYVAEWTPLAKRGWRWKIYGPPSVPVSAAGLFLGQSVEVVKNPLYGAEYGITRVHRGAPITLSWRNLTEADTEAILLAIQTVTAAWPAEAPTTSRAGFPSGARPFYLYDPTGEVFRGGLTATPTLLHVICTSPEIVPTATFHRLWTIGPVRFEVVP